jgi:hypothetical protein
MLVASYTPIHFKIVATSSRSSGDIDRLFDHPTLNRELLMVLAISY